MQGSTKKMQGHTCRALHVFSLHVRTVRLQCPHVRKRASYCGYIGRYCQKSLWEPTYDAGLFEQIGISECIYQACLADMMFFCQRSLRDPPAWQKGEKGKQVWVTACKQVSFADIWGSFAKIWGSFVDMGGSFVKRASDTLLPGAMVTNCDF